MADASGEIRVGHVAELWRYPVKSMGGDRVECLQVMPEGIEHDRRYAFESSGAPHGKPLLTGRERAAMLLYTASIDAGTVQVRNPEGHSLAVDDPELLRGMEAGLSISMPNESLARENTPTSLRRHTLHLRRSEVPLTDCRPIALLSCNAIARISREMGEAVDARRFRANIVMTFEMEREERAGMEMRGSAAGSGEAPGFPEDALVGRRIRAGSASLRVTERDPRCRIVTLDPDTAEAKPSLMKYLDRLHEGRFGVYAATLTPGKICVGDAVWLA